VAGVEGKFVQGFPEYGPERMGAPITAYNRICETRCTIHSNIYYPDYVVVLDETLLDSVDVAGGLKEGGAVIINTPKSPQEMRSKLRGWTGKVCTIDARRISEEILGKNFPNTPMLAAVVKISSVLEPARFLANIEEGFRHKFATKPGVIEGNMATLIKSMEEVQVG
jgi:pyruvate ferredoxin oxidoreductase gamma subunit